MRPLYRPPCIGSISTHLSNNGESAVFQRSGVSEVWRHLVYGDLWLIEPGRSRCSSSHCQRCCSDSNTEGRYWCHCCNCQTEGPPPDAPPHSPVVISQRLNPKVAHWGSCALRRTPRPPSEAVTPPRRQVATEEGRSRRPSSHSQRCCSDPNTEGRSWCHSCNRQTEGPPP